MIASESQTEHRHVEALHNGTRGDRIYRRLTRYCSQGKHEGWNVATTALLTSRILTIAVTIYQVSALTMSAL